MKPGALCCASVLAAIACGSPAPKQTTTTTTTTSTSSSETVTPARPSGPRTEIKTTEGAVKLGLASDTVYMGLSDSLLASIRDSMSTDSDGGGIGGSMSRFIKRSVGSALKTQVTYPIQDIQSAKYENGKIQFVYRQKRRMSFEDVQSNKKNALEDFAPADAQRFVSAVNAAIASHKATP